MTALRLEPITPDEYVRSVLPQTFEAWGGQRSFERYVEDFSAIAALPYARRRTFTLGLRDGNELAASCKTYERLLRWGTTSLSATGIGAVYTPPARRGRGYATALLGALLDAERAAGRDLAFLFSDIHPEFYARLGFVALPSRLLTINAASLDGSRVTATPLETRDWPGLRRCFEMLDAERPWSLRRTPLVWNWMRHHWSAPVREGTQSVQLVVRRERTIAAYVLGRRTPRADAFVLEDFGFEGELGRAIVPALVRCAAGDLRRIVGWLPPQVARDALPRGSVRARKDAIFMVALLSRTARVWWAANKDETLAGRADACWDADHV